MNKIPNRKQRREVMKYQGVLGLIGKLSYSKRAEIRQGQLQKGKEIHAANVDAADREMYTRLEAKEVKMMQTWREIGYNEAEIETLREAWHIDAVGGASREDKKHRQSLLKGASESRLSRVT